EPLAQQPRDQIGAAAGRKRHDPAYGPRRIGVGRGEPRHGGRRGGEAGKAKEVAARKHNNPILAWYYVLASPNCAFDARITTRSMYIFSIRHPSVAEGASVGKASEAAHSAK